MYQDDFGDGWVDDCSQVKLSKTTRLGKPGLFGLFGKEQNLEVYSTCLKDSYDDYSRTAKATFGEDGLPSFRQG
jgi:hypothetical protein